MTVFNAILYIFASAVGCSYGWGMRGSVIGGEKGAMLPGALLGLLTALFSGSSVLSSQSFLLSGVGALAMYCGGNMTYADTLKMTAEKEYEEKRKNAFLGVFIKGFVWFGLFGGFVSLYISVLGGYYNASKLGIFFVLLPVFALVFYKIFNLPFNADKNIFPKIYFSLNRRETWGGLLGILIEIILFAAVNGDFYTLLITAFSSVSGGAGWLLGQHLQFKTLCPDKKGRTYFSSANKNGFIDTWKLMECTFGAVAGAGTALGFVLAEKLVPERLTAIDSLGAAAFLNETASDILFYLYAAVLLADAVGYFIVPSTNKRYFKKLKKMRLISQEDYENSVKNDKPTESEKYKKYKRIREKSEFAVYSMIPLTLSFFGCEKITVTVYFCVIMLVLCQEVSEKCFGDSQGAFIWKLVMFLPSAAVFATQAITGKPFSAVAVTVLYTFIYEGANLCLKLWGPEKSKFTGSDKTVHGYFLICCLVLNILALAI